MSKAKADAKQAWLAAGGHPDWLTCNLPPRIRNKLPARYAAMLNRYYAAT